MSLVWRLVMTGESPRRDRRKWIPLALLSLQLVAALGQVIGFPHPMGALVQLAHRGAASASSPSADVSFSQAIESRASIIRSLVTPGSRVMISFAYADDIAVAAQVRNRFRYTANMELVLRSQLREIVTQIQGEPIAGFFGAIPVELAAELATLGYARVRVLTADALSNEVFEAWIRP